MQYRKDAMTNRFVKLDSWVRELIVDPLSKEPLTPDNGSNWLVSSYGRKYPVSGDLLDLRLLNNQTTDDQKIWEQGQREYEKWNAALSSQDNNRSYLSDIESLREVYDQIPVQGRCLDVGGHQGRLRKFLAPGQEYLSCDPSLKCFDDLEDQPNLLKAYPFLLDPVNFVCCDAEFLPFRSLSFQTVHMRSVIDHLLSPELALNEAYRVLEADGALIVGLYVHGGKRGRSGMVSCIKEYIKAALEKAGINRFKDYHIWHPAYKELTDLIEDCGFTVEKTYWQKGHNDSVCYILARKHAGLISKRSAGCRMINE